MYVLYGSFSIRSTYLVVQCLFVDLAEDVAKNRARAILVPVGVLHATGKRIVHMLMTTLWPTPTHETEGNPPVGELEGGSRARHGQQVGTERSMYVVDSGRKQVQDTKQ